jgi:hypothetical protein
MAPVEVEDWFLDRGHGACLGTISVLTLDQGKLRSDLQVDHHADAAVELKKGSHCLPGQYFSKDRYIPLTKFCEFDVRVQPSANQTVCLGIGQGSIFVGILFDDRRSRIDDLPHICRVFLIHLPELGSFTVRER